MPKKVSTYRKERGQMMTRVARIVGLQERIFCLYFEQQYLKVFEELIDLEVIGFNPIQKTYHEILERRAETIDSEGGNINIIADIISRKIPASNKHYKSKEKQIQLASLLAKHKEIIFPKKPLISCNTIRKVNEKLISKN